MYVCMYAVLYVCKNMYANMEGFSRDTTLNMQLLCMRTYTAVQKPKSLLVLCEEGLVVFDISEVGNPQYNVSFVLDLHKPAVTSVEYVNECPDNLTSSLYSVQSKQLVKDNPFKVRTLLVAVCIRTYVLRTYVLEMQQYIDISPYCDTLGSDTVSIHI